MLKYYRENNLFKPLPGIGDVFLKISSGIYKGKEIISLNIIIALVSSEIYVLSIHSDLEWG